MIILLTDKDILLFHQNQSIEEAKFTYFVLGKAIEKLAKNYVNASKLIKDGLIFDRLK